MIKTIGEHMYKANFITSTCTAASKSSTNTDSVLAGLGMSTLRVSYPSCQGGFAPWTPSAALPFAMSFVPVGGVVVFENRANAQNNGGRKMAEAVEERRGKYPCSVRTRISIPDYEKLTTAAETAGMSMGQYARHRLSGAHVSSKIDVCVLNELRRLGGLLKMLASQGQPTAPALSELRATMKQLQTNN